MRWTKQEIARSSHAVRMAFELYREVKEFSLARQRMENMDKELRSTLVMLGYDRDSAAWA